MFLEKRYLLKKTLIILLIIISILSLILGFLHYKNMNASNPLPISLNNDNNVETQQNVD